MNAFDAWDFELLDLDLFRRLGPDQLRYLLRFSLLAPSTHNSVPQAYVVDAERRRIDLFLDRRNVLSASDPTARQALVSVGCALENLTLTAEQYGLRSRWIADPRLTWPARKGPGDARFVRLGRVELGAAERVPSEAARRSMLTALLERRVVRAEFDPGVALPEALLAAIRAATAEFPELRLTVATTPADRFAWGKLAEVALKHELELAEFRAELGRWLLDNDDVTSARGMRGREFGLDDESTRSLAGELRGDLPLASEKLALLARAERNAVVSSSAVCVLATIHDTPVAAIDTGRAYQRAAIVAWQQRFAHAVHAAIVEVSHVRAICRATLLAGRALPSLVFRLGKPLREPDWKRPHSSRPRLDDLIFSASVVEQATCP